MLTLEAGASPRSIAATDAFIASFQSDPASHGTFRPVHHTAKAAQRAAKLAHLKAACQAQRLVRPSTSPVRSCSPSHGPQRPQGPKHMTSASAEALTTTETECPQSTCQTPKAVQRTTASSPASPLSRVPVQPDAMPAVLNQAVPPQALSARGYRTRQHNNTMANAAGQAEPVAAGSRALSARALRGQKLSRQCLDLPAPGAFMARQRSGLGPGPHPVHDACLQESTGPLATQPSAAGRNHIRPRPVSRASASESDPAACCASAEASHQHGNACLRREKLRPADSIISSQAQLKKMQLKVCGSGVAPATASLVEAMPVGEQACSSSEDDATTQRPDLGPAVIIGSAPTGYVSPTRNTPGSPLQNAVALCSAGCRVHCASWQQCSLSF